MSAVTLIGLVILLGVLTYGFFKLLNSNPHGKWVSWLLLAYGMSFVCIVGSIFAVVIMRMF